MALEKGDIDIACIPVDTLSRFKNKEAFTCKIVMIFPHTLKERQTVGPSGHRATE